MSYPFLIFFGLAPSLIWLLFYLRKDTLPESNLHILEVFLLGILSALLTALIELGICLELNLSASPSFSSMGGIFIFFLLGVAFPEELMKYLVVRFKVLKSAAFDEPVDAMLYMIIASLGFAAAENILLLSPLREIIELFAASWLRFIGATFLHALCGGIVGYYLALSCLHSKRRFQLLVKGLAIAVFLHALFNFLIIITKGESLSFLAPTLLLVAMAVFVFNAFKKVKKMKSICLPFQE
jgi:protease PrsW